MDEMTTGAPLQDVLVFPFQGSEWRGRFVIGSVLVISSFLVPVVPLLFVYGYALAVMRRATEGEELTLPRWDDWGKLAGDGLRATVVGLVYLLPGLLVILVGMALYFVAVVATPLAVETANENLWALLLFGSVLIMFLAIFLGTLLTLLGAIPVPMATAHMAAEDDLMAAFRVRQWWKAMRANPLGVIVAWVVMAGLMAVVYLIVTMIYTTIVLCCTIPFLAGPMVFYLLLVGAGLFGRVYRESWEKVAVSEEGHP